MTKDMYEFFHLRCGFIAHYDILGFRATYEDPHDFESFCNTLKANLMSDIKYSNEYNNADHTDSFKFDYEFKIPEVKKAMLSLLNNNSATIENICNKGHLTNLISERKRLDGKIELLQKTVSNAGLNKFI